MKIRIELNELLQEEEVIIRCPILTEKVQKIQKILFETDNSSDKMILFKNETEYYLNLDDILFFETGIRGIEAHTIDDIFQTKFKLLILSFEDI
jgi:DNA-binding LytR/AlgR family response regulator